MTDTKRPLKVFLCHASADKPKVRELYRAPRPECFAIEGLKRRGIQPRLDAEDLIPGQNWELEIRKAVRESDVMIHNTQSDKRMFSCPIVINRSLFYGYF